MKIITKKSYKITRHHTRTGKTEIFTATIDWIEQRKDFLYIGYTPHDNKYGKFGSLRYYTDDSKLAIKTKIEAIN